MACSKVTYFRPMVLIALITLCFGISSSWGQITNVTDDTSTPIEGAGHDYIHLLSETVNPANGSVSLRLKMPIPKSRGTTIPFSITYDSNGVSHVIADQGLPGYSIWQTNEGYLSSGGWSLSVPMFSYNTWNAQYGSVGNYYTCYVFSNYMFDDASGGRHALGLGTQFTTPPTGQGTCPTNGAPGDNANGGDSQVGAWLPPTHPDPTYNPSATGDWPVTASTVDGTGYYANQTQIHNVGGTQYALPSSIEDRNGNIVQVTDNNNSSFVITDTAGRPAVSANGFGPSGQTNTVTLSDQTYQITWTTVSSSYTVPSTQVDIQQGVSCEGIPAVSLSQVVLDHITLPNNQAIYFKYQNSYGLLSEIDYPSGAWVKYTWQLGDNTGMNEFITFPGAVTNGPPVNDGCLYQYESPRVASRTVGFGGSPTSLTQSFSYSTTWNSSGTTWAAKSTTLTNTDPVLGSANTSYTYTPVSVPPMPFVKTNYPGQVPVESTTAYNDWGNSATLRTVTKLWYNPYDLKSESVLEGGKSSQTTYCYVGGACGPGILAQLKETDEYDFGAATPTKKTVTTYQSFSRPYPYGVIADAPCSIVVSDGNGNHYAETDYYYDGGTTLCGTTSAAVPVAGDPGTVTAHDDTHFAKSSTVPRGNVTAKVQRETVGTSPVTTYSYDKTGQVVSVTDPCGNPNGTCTDVTGSSHASTFSYTDSYTVQSGGVNNPYAPSVATDAYLTQITDALSHTMNFTYDYHNGQLTASADANAKSTTYVYYDAFDRPTLVNYPDGGQKTLVYNDSSYNPATPSPSVQVSTLLATGTPNVNIISTTAFDGIGHTVETILSSDPSGSDYQTTSYYGIGKPYQLTNPHRSTSSPTDGTTIYLYDGLGRAKQVTKPDGSIVTSVYDQTNAASTGLCTTVTDEAGKSRQSCVDGLGRLTGVWEDPSGLNYETDYIYDPLNNLTNVNQKGSNSSNARSRSFVYDSLSRLTSATIPESGSTTYGYDANGNLSTRLAPSPNQAPTGNQVTTSYTYDVLNRLTGKSYSDSYSQNPSTPAVTYAYDGNNISSCPTQIGITGGGAAQNVIGRRSAMCFGGGSKSWEFDPVGRISVESERFIYLVCPCAKDVYTINGVSTLSVYTDYNYYLNGDLGSVDYPNPYGPPNYEFFTQENAAGQVIKAGDTQNIALSAATYDPAGQLATGLVGSNGASNASSISNTYNNRLQPVLVSAMAPPSSGAQILKLTYNFNLGNGTSGSDNGNVIQIANGKDDNRTQNFLYDPLNRVWQAYTNGTNWGETYSPAPQAAGTVFSAANAGIDAWGNWTNGSGVTGKTNSESNLNCGPANTSNQLNTCFTYDLAGDLIKNGSATYMYDAENRLIATGGISYLYDGDGNRVQKCTEGTVAGTCATTPTGTLYFVHKDGGPMAESDLSGNWTADYGLIGGRVAQRVDYPSGAVRFYYHDNLGSTSVVTDISGNILKESDYYPYGGEIPITSNDSNRYKFTGKERDSESGLDNFGARYNASSMGRFMTPDPLLSSGHPSNPQTWNRYAYVLNNPLSIIDPTGLYDLVNNCASDDKKCNKQFQQDAKNLKQGLADLQKKVDNMKDGPEKQRLEASLKALGTEGDNNNVNVKFGTNADGAAGNTQTVADKTGVSFNVTLDPNKISGGTNYWGIDAAHEGTHVADISDPRYANTATTLSDFSLEYRGYQTSAWAAQALGVSPLAYDGGRNVIWNSSWGAVDRQTLMDKGITQHVTSIPGHQETTPHNPWPN